MKKTIGILLVVAVLAFSLTSCGGSGGGGNAISNLINKVTGNSSVDYSFTNKNFGYANGSANEVLLLFTSETAVTHRYNGVNHVGTYTAEKAKSGTLTITYTDGTAQYSKAFTFGDDGNKVTGVTIDGLVYSRY